MSGWRINESRVIFTYFAADGKRSERIGLLIGVHRANGLHERQVQLLLHRRHLQQNDELLLLGELALEDVVAAPLHEALEQRVEHVRPVAHQPHVVARRVHALAVRDRPLEHVGELGLGAQVAGPHKVHHAPVLGQVVLERVAREHDAPLGHYPLQGLGYVGHVVLDAVALVAHDQTRRQQSGLQLAHVRQLWVVLFDVDALGLLGLVCVEAQLRLVFHLLAGFGVLYQGAEHFVAN